MQSQAAIHGDRNDQGTEADAESSLNTCLFSVHVGPRNSLPRSLRGDGARQRLLGPQIESAPIPLQLPKQMPGHLA
jgi:hypothetical protein